jgi:hypothetical protein
VRRRLTTFRPPALDGKMGFKNISFFQENEDDKVSQKHNLYTNGA